jgi:3-oxoacyl-[acyl-carrier-protein] synthase-3
MSTGLISMAAYRPAEKLEEKMSKALSEFLQNRTLLPKEYIETIEKTGCLPGKVESNYEGWESQPWYEAWLKSLPLKKQADPFQGTCERRRVPMDPSSVRESVYPHPMLPSDAEVIVSSMAILRSGMNPDDIDLVMAHSQVPDRPLPQNVSLIQYKLGLKNAGAYSLDTCCSSFVSMIEVAVALVKSGIKKNVLIVSSYIDSHVNDKSTHFSVDTGDGAAAGIISSCDMGYLASHSSSHGDRHDGIVFETRLPLLYKGLHTSPDHRQLVTTFLNRKACKEIAVNADRDMLFVVSQALEKAEMKKDDIDFFVTHQPVAWTGETWRKAVGVPEDKFYETFRKYGNIATAAAATNFTEALEKNLIKTGDKVLIASSGAGENHIAVLHQVSPTLVENINRFK